MGGGGADGPIKLSTCLKWVKVYHKYSSANVNMFKTYRNTNKIGGEFVE